MPATIQRTTPSSPIAPVSTASCHPPPFAPSCRTGGGRHLVAALPADVAGIEAIFEDWYHRREGDSRRR
ncbi:hypothetical protein ACFU7Y_22910 [Kitasatospora sp. NPDC057542]|uniref:hypothetical protein n=1 Tax=Kitasatospora sp. NPDC057542 TaxID=3346162 RepID=UPI00369E35BA